MEFLDSKQKSQLRQKAASRAKHAAEKARLRESLSALKIERKEATLLLERAAESRNEREIKTAIKLAKSLGLQGQVYH